MNKSLRFNLGKIIFDFNFARSLKWEETKPSSKTTHLLSLLVLNDHEKNKLISFILGPFKLSIGIPSNVHS